VWLVVKELGKVVIALSFQLIGRNELQGSGIDAVTQTTLVLWAVGKDVAQVRTRVRAPNFLARHAKRMVRVGKTVATDRLVVSFLI